MNRSTRKRTHKSLGTRAIEAGIILVALVLLIAALFMAADCIGRAWDAETRSHDAAIEYFQAHGHMPAGYDE